jgi:hypothetical protein
MAKESFAKASDILALTQPPKPSRKFTTDAVEVRKLADELGFLLEQGGELKDIDAKATALQMKCLGLQQLTLRARRESSR